MRKKRILISATCLLTAIIIISAIFFINKVNNATVLAEEDNKKLDTIEIAKTSDDIDNTEKNIVLDLKSDLDYALDISDKEVRKENAEYVIIGRINSIDGSTNYNEEQDEYTAIFTYGQIDVITVLQGNIETTEIPFIRLGGEITFDEYEKGLTNSQKEKMDLVRTLTDDEKATSYVSYSPNGDIELEEGKYYLIYMNYNTDYDRYICSYMQYGTREVDATTLNNNIQTYSGIGNNSTGIRVKNNETGEWENLSDVF